MKKIIILSISIVMILILYCDKVNASTTYKSVNFYDSNGNELTTNSYLNGGKQIGLSNGSNTIYTTNTSQLDKLGITRENADSITFSIAFVNNAQSTITGSSIIVQTRNVKNNSFVGWTNCEVSNSITNNLDGKNYYYYVMTCPFITNGDGISAIRISAQNVQPTFSAFIISTFAQLNFENSQMIEQQQHTNEILEENNTYTTTPTEQTNSTQIDNYQQKEQEIFDSLEFNGTSNLDITINPNASNFIWDIVDGLRGMSAKIITLFTSILGLGIIKLILNR